ncbi:MAG: DUF4226 domain-containing protein [Mycobacterium sp.]|nr:DUF4226 domain-containing protein [Mycobacterium sp.]
MATPNDVLAAIEHVTECTGNQQAWLTGLTPQEVADAATIFAASPRRLDGLIYQIRQHHPDLFDPTTGEMVFPARPGPASRRPTTAPPDGTASAHQEGDAADAIRNAEAALAHQNSATAQLDLQVITAILNAHQKTAEGTEALNRLQDDIEAAVRTRSDLDTPAGARDFQRFLIGKLRDIRAVVANANLDDTSSSALMSAWTSLYNSAESGGADGADGQENNDNSAQPRSPAEPVVSPAQSASLSGPAAPDAAMDPYSDSLLADEPGWVSSDSPAPIPTSAVPLTPSIPSFCGGAMPGGGEMPGWAMPGGFGLPGSARGSDERSSTDVDDPPQESNAPEASTSDDDQADPESADATAGEPPISGPTTVTLPDGETLTAASPALAAAIKAAVAGTPIADAFRQQGITIPPPGTAVAEPLDPARLAPGDIGMFTTRHALALGQSRALLDGQIQHISTVNGPSFLGWEHPPEPVPAVAPARTDPPVPTRPATAASP